MPLAPSSTDPQIDDDYDLVEFPHTPSNIDASVTSQSPSSAVTTTTTTTSSSSSLSVPSSTSSIPNKKFMEDTPKVAQGSVMKETIALADSITANITHLAEDVTSAAAAVTAHEVHGRLVQRQLGEENKNKTTDLTNTAPASTPTPATPSAEEAALNQRSRRTEQEQRQLAERHTQVVKRSAEAGKLVGSLFGAQAGKLVHFLARRTGAHQCDGCNKTNLYDYYICQKCEDYDLCASCHSNFRSNPSSVNHPSTHSFEFHQNGIFAIKLLGAVVLALVLVRAIFGII